MPFVSRSLWFQQRRDLADAIQRASSAELSLSLIRHELDKVKYSDLQVISNHVERHERLYRKETP